MCISSSKLSAQVGGYVLELAEREGFWLVAPTTYWQASAEELEKHTGGCGPGKLGDLFVPDTAYGESIFLACQIHDWMYYVGKTAQDKKIADLMFLVNMILMVDDGDFLDEARLYRCMTYYVAVSRCGDESFGGTDDKKL